MDTLPFGLQPFESAAQARNRATRRLFEYWQGLVRDGLPPTRSEIDPAAIRDILPYVMLGEIEGDPFRVRFRLVGTAVAEFSRLDFTGRYLDELGYDARDSVEWRQCYEIVHAQRIGVIGENRLSLTDGRATAYEFAILPLRRGDDPAGSFIAIEAYEGVERTRIPDLTPVTRGS